MSQFTFEIVTEGDDVVSTRLMNVDADTATHAWRRIGGQLINATDTDDFVVLSIRIVDTQLGLPNLISNQWRLRK